MCSRAQTWSTAMEITTRRFLLRDFEEGDRAGFLAYHADPRMLALHGSQEADPNHASRLLDTFALWASERPRRNYQLAIVPLPRSPALVGCSGLRRGGCEGDRAEFGIELAPDFWGRHGYAIEVARALLDFGFRDQGLREIRGLSTEVNVRVARLASWFGAVAVASGGREREWRMSRERWERRAGLERVRRNARGREEPQCEREGAS
jgi:[ribosomal protein S5]-alanine N-acetyltransferase